MKSQEVRSKFLKFFEDKGHMIVPSYPMVMKDDPTLMFVNKIHDMVNQIHYFLDQIH